MTYDSFTSEWGPGPAVEKAFEEHCGCDLRFVTGGDGAALLARLQLEGATSEADVVLGLDTNLTAQARATGLFAPHGAPAATALPVAWQDDLFLPYDWGWFAFVYDTSRTAMPPEDFRALGDSDLFECLLHGFGRCEAGRDVDRPELDAEMTLADPWNGGVPHSLPAGGEGAGGIEGD